ncbi:MAG: alanine racemase [Chlamydiia bacterium]|nr:alanine racemase [Chlamydiia bacterium]
MSETQKENKSINLEVLRYQNFENFQKKNTCSIEKIARSLLDVPCENCLYIDIGAIRFNLEVIRTHLPRNTRILIMVKARGYGTDHVMLGHILASFGIDILGVAHIDEAIALREGGIVQSIFVINTPPFEVKKLIHYECEVGVSDETLVQTIEKEARKKNKMISVHLHIDTGMNRFGCKPKDALNLAKQIQASPHLKLVGVMTHLAAADQENDDLFTHNQIRIFGQALEGLKREGIQPPFIHLANSSGMLRFPLPFCNMVRLGLAPFGIVSSAREQTILPLRNALSLVSRIAGINLCKRGETVGYGRTYHITEEEQTIGIIPLGYFDGIHRHYSGKGYVLIHGKQAPMVGRICMDYMMVDLTEIKDAKVGDHVLIFGEDFDGHSLPPETFATWGETDVRELIACLGPRIQRLFIERKTACIK